ncbi:hypothetical protein F3523_05195 [Campylobacter upsaliensis]|nr:hypothetical protein [Campylobacter upsaliensis]EAH6029474.1 hypothetical protein [Campylobacter upsaliensis]ECW8267738.1 hypothetical protein [Campylobacter upsaliensis]ELE1411428.1 hypothetical protein [Campylobacter upsaliensis]
MPVKKEVLENEVKSPKQKNKEIYVDLAKFLYIGDEPYHHKDAKGKDYVFTKNDVIIMSEGEGARYFDYKNTLFKRTSNA